MSAREEFLNSVRAALGRNTGQSAAPAPPPRLSIPEIPPQLRIAMFRERLEALGGVVHVVNSREQARGVASEIVGQGPAVASNSAVLREAGITTLAGVLSGVLEEAALRQACAAAACGITSAEYGLAETGTLVLRSSREEARLISLLPPVHVALLPASRLITGLDELFAAVPRPAQGSSSLVLITGPSRSADIEMILVRGVHGPRVIHVIVLNEEPPTTR
jgi:L-lactate dehydrogenase complex protein LldG